METFLDFQDNSPRMPTDLLVSLGFEWFSPSSEYFVASSTGIVAYSAGIFEYSGQGTSSFPPNGNSELEVDMVSGEIVVAVETPERIVAETVVAEVSD